MTSVDATTRVLIADDDPVIRMLLRVVIGGEPDLELVAEAEDAAQAVALADAHRPDVALLDLEMPNGGGLRAATDIRAARPQTRVLVLSGDERPEARDAIAEAGAVGQLLKGLPPDDIVRAIRAAGDGAG